MSILNDLDASHDQIVPTLTDERGLTLINRAAADNSLSLASFVIKYVRERYI